MTSQVMTTEQLRTQRKPDDVEAGFNTYRGFQAMSHMAESLANSTIIPEAFRNTIMVKDHYDQRAKKWIFRPEANPNGVSNCIIALNMAQRLGADPMMIMQNLYLVDGRPSWSSQFIIAAINSSGRYSPLRFDISGGDEDTEIPYAVTEWVYSQATNKKEPVESNQVARVKNFKCVAWVIEKATGERLESTPITMEMAVKEGWYQKNGSKWQSMPEQMLRYRAASFFGRIYAPDLLMGLRTQEEELDSMIDVTPEPTPQEIPATLESIKQNVVKEVAANAQNSASNDVEKKSSPKKPEQVKKEAPPAEAAPAKKTQARQPKATAAEENKLTDAAENQNPPVVNEIKSNAIAGGLKISIQDAANLDALTAIAQTIRDSKPKLTQDHLNDVLNVYAARKKFLEDQQDMFAGVPEVSFFDSALSRIRNAKSQDDINEVYADPAFDELSGENRERLDKEAQQRESELQD